MSSSTIRSSEAAQPAGEASPATDGPPLLVVIVNFRTPDVTIACLRTLAPEIATLPGARAVVVDNGSGDGSAEKLAAAVAAEGWSGWATIRACDRNGGFSWGNNRGVEVAPRAQSYLLLNSDTLVGPGVLRHCQAVLAADPRIGAMSTLILNEDGSIQNVARRFATLPRRAAGALGLPWRFPRAFEWANLEDPSWDRRSVTRDVDWLGGAFLWVRGDVLRAVGGLDEDFFFYGEDVALCHRVWRAGYRCVYAPGPTVIHLGAVSSDPSRMASGARLVHAWRARHLGHLKMYGRASALAALGVDVAVHAAKLVKYRLTGRSARPEAQTSREVLRLALRPGALGPHPRAPAGPGRPETTP